MSTYDDALVERAAEVLRGLERQWGHTPDATGIDSEDAARAVLDAVADELRAEGSTRYRLAWQSAKRRRGWTWVQRVAERNVAHEIEHLEAERDRWKQRWQDTIAADQERMAEAWDEGAHAGRVYQQRLQEYAGPTYFGTGPTPVANPYREDA